MAKAAVHAAVLILYLAGARASFRIVDDEFEGASSKPVLLKVLENTDTGESASVIYSHGGRVEQVSLVPRGARASAGAGPVPLLQDFGRNATAVDLNEHWQGAMLAPFANRVANGTYDFDGATHYLDRNECDDPSARCGALHGMLWRYALELRGATATNASAALVLGHEFDGADAGYPWTVDVELTYELFADGRFDVTVRAANVDRAATRRPAPWTFGWHPYFRVADVAAAAVRFDACAAPWLHVDMTAGAPRAGDLVPTGAASAFDASSLDPIGAAQSGSAALPNYYDDEWKAGSSGCDDARGVATRVATATHTAVLWQDGHFRFTQLFTGAYEGWNSSSVAFEPMSGMADAYNNGDGLVILSAGESWTATFGVRAELNGAA